VAHHWPKLPNHICIVRGLRNNFTRPDIAHLESRELLECASHKISDTSARRATAKRGVAYRIRYLEIRKDCNRFDGAERGESSPKITRGSSICASRPHPARPAERRQRVPRCEPRNTTRDLVITRTRRSKLKHQHHHHHLHQPLPSSPLLPRPFSSPITLAPEALPQLSDPRGSYSQIAKVFLPLPPRSRPVTLREPTFLTFPHPIKGPVCSLSGQTTLVS
jgi:hypothetical protein